MKPFFNKILNFWDYSNLPNNRVGARFLRN
jgi:hypothetical protein